MKILLTGGGGFIGSHVVDLLLNEKHQVVVVDDFSSGKVENISKGAACYSINMNDTNLENVFLAENPDIVIHLAEQVSVTKSMDNPLSDCVQTINGTINLLECCIKYKVKKIIYSSSAAVYGKPTYVPIDENHVLAPKSFYGLSKLTGEAYVQLYSKLYNLNYTILRYANVYGPRQSNIGEAGVIRRFLDSFMLNQPLTVYGDGNQRRDFVYVKDVAEATLQAIHHGDYETFNISSNTTKSINDLIFLLSLFMDTKPEIIHLPEPLGDIRISCLSNEKANKLLHWQPKITLIEGIEETILSLQS
ncbi:UDP-glucose 4-epimerase [Bacillus sp. FJAT-27225]|uniref:NAD-dependent epimerase/dehydratase family protein n=1 Tax=Bacillus sp. FJAT-27225 TaxID=1743144 RepID=UPI00080C2BD8|nr:NAD-dependent epimerase/dehydratase family protein [Bacillus sp. FJAT-27225]OCA83350.1 UDP-glucose 4-epimerase [Bacillus sp. FJAT-27225]